MLSLKDISEVQVEMIAVDQKKKSPNGEIDDGDLKWTPRISVFIRQIPLSIMKDYRRLISCLSCHLDLMGKALTDEPSDSSLSG